MRASRSWPSSRRPRQGADNGRPERAKVLALARAYKVDAVLVTELAAGRRSAQALVQTLDALRSQHRERQADANNMAGLPEFEGDLIRDRIKSGLAAAKARGAKLGRQVGAASRRQKAKRVLGMHADRLSYRLMARNVA